MAHNGEVVEDNVFFIKEDISDCDDHQNNEDPHPPGNISQKIHEFLHTIGLDNLLPVATLPLHPAAFRFHQ